jgi:hypothetical protein
MEANLKKSINKKVSDFASIEQLMRDSLGMGSDTQVVDAIIAIGKEFPQDATTISTGTAQYLCGRFLQGTILCNELFAMAVGYEMKMEVARRRALGEAVIIKAKAAGIKTAKECEFYAHTDEDYLAAAEALISAKMIRTLIEGLRKDFDKSHYFMRSIYQKELMGDDSVVPHSGDVSEESDTYGW